MPLYLIAMWKDGRKGKDKYIFDRIFYCGVPSLIDLLNQVHAILQPDEVMLEGEAFGLISQQLDGAEDSGPGGSNHDSHNAKGMPDWASLV
jgi:hypothetical protein